MRKKFSLNSIVASIVLLLGTTSLMYSLSGCSSLYNDDASINWNNVSVINTATTAATTAIVYSVTSKNEDLAPIFTSIGESLVLLTGSSTSEFTPTQLSTYITDLINSMSFVNDVEQEAVEGVLVTCLNTYTEFYTTNESLLKDNVQLAASFINAIGVGLIAGSESFYTNTAEEAIANIYNNTNNLLLDIDLNIKKSTK